MDKVTSQENLPVLVAGAAIGGIAACLYMKRCSMSAPSLDGADMEHLFM